VKKQVNKMQDNSDHEATQKEKKREEEEDG
jgi:hypothetical protein